MTMTEKPIYYAVRRPGCAAWAERLTEAEAREELRRANAVAPGHEAVAHYRDGRTEWVPL